MKQCNRIDGSFLVGFEVLQTQPDIKKTLDFYLFFYFNLFLSNMIFFFPYIY